MILSVVSYNIYHNYISHSGYANILRKLFAKLSTSGKSILKTSSRTSLISLTLFSTLSSDLRIRPTNYMFDF